MIMKFLGTCFSLVFFSAAVFAADSSGNSAVAESSIPAQVTTPAEVTDDTDLTEMSLEDLLNVKVTTITKTEVSLVDAPAAMVVISKEDIKTYGYKNLTDALQRIPETYLRFEGHNMGNDFRGFFTNNTRRQVLYLIDGHRVNDRFHFGDFYGDIIGDLENVQRIEVIRGPGAALYGNNALLGVVNVITKSASNLAENTSSADGKISLEQVASGSMLQKYQVDFLKKWDSKLHFSLDAYWYQGSTNYDAKNDWTTSQATSPGKVNYIQGHDFYTSIKGKSGDEDARNFKGGVSIPNFQAVLGFGDFKIGSFVHTKKVTWVPPRDTMTFGDSRNIRSWGTASVFADYEPSTGIMKELDFKSRLSFNINTNREASQFSTQDLLSTGVSIFENRASSANVGPGSGDGSGGGNFRYTDNGDGTYTQVGTTTAPTTADGAARGGGANGYYTGLDQTYSFETQLTVYKKEKTHISLGGNYEISSYENQQWMTYNNDEFLGFYRFGGITDKGYSYGLWSQFIFEPIENLTVTAGLRTDYQMIKEVYRNFGGKKLFYRDATTGVYTALSRENQDASNTSPRLALNYRFNNNTNLRLIYAEAFRAVPPQETIRLAGVTGSVPSEVVKSTEAIVAHTFSPEFQGSLGYFSFESNRLFVWDPGNASFNQSSGYTNKGFTTMLNYVFPRLESWLSYTQMQLRRPAANQPDDKPLDSPMTLVKAGGSYRLASKLSLALEGFYNGPIDGLQKTDGTNLVEQTVPASTYFNLTLRQEMAKYGVKDIFVDFRVKNLLDSAIHYQLSQEGQNHSIKMYSRPGELPGFGRQFELSAQYIF